MDTPTPDPPKFTDPFTPEEVDWRVVQKSSNDKKRGMVVCYIDARAVMDRLDLVTDHMHATWSTEYTVLSDNRHVECRITLHLPDGQMITRADVGQPGREFADQAKQDRAADIIKAAYSDALKRAAVQWGIGRYLYQFGEAWVDLDEYGKITPGAFDKLRQGYAKRVGIVAPGTSVPPRTPAPEPAAASSPPETPRNVPAAMQMTPGGWKAFWAMAERQGYDQAAVFALAGTRDIENWPKGEVNNLMQRMKKAPRAAA